MINHKYICLQGEQKGVIKNKVSSFASSEIIKVLLGDTVISYEIPKLNYLTLDNSYVNSPV